MRRKQQTRWSVLIFGIFMSLIMVGSLATGWLLQITQQRDLARQQAELNEPTPLPTFEPPIAVDTINFERTALQGNGLFSVGIPEPPEWGAIESSLDRFANRARLLMRDELNVIEATAEEPTTPVTSAEDLNAVFTEQSLGASWRNYASWDETARETITVDGQEYLQMDFELEFGGRTYLSRQRAWTDGERVYSVRVVTPQNARDLLLFLLDSTVSSFDVIERFTDVPLIWKAYYDSTLEHIIRYPDTWNVTDAAEGLPASIETETVSLRIEAVDGESADDEAAAEAYVSGLIGVDEVLSVTEIQRGDLGGYAVSYRASTFEGIPVSGLVVLLNGEDMLHVANLSVEDIDTDLNAPDDNLAETVAPYVQTMATFSPLSGYVYAEEAIASSAPLTQGGTGQGQIPQIPNLPPRPGQ